MTDQRNGSVSLFHHIPVLIMASSSDRALMQQEIAAPGWIAAHPAAFCLLHAGCIGSCY